MKPAEKCWVCLRITPAEILKLTHKIWENSRIARKIGLKAASLIHDSYLQKPFFFCGFPMKTLLSGLFFLLGVQIGAPKRVVDIAEPLGITKVSVTKSYRRWLSEFPKYFREFSLQPMFNSFGKPCGRALLFNGKLVRILVPRNRDD